MSEHKSIIKYIVSNYVKVYVNIYDGSDGYGGTYSVEESTGKPKNYSWATNDGWYGRINMTGFTVFGENGDYDAQDVSAALIEAEKLNTYYAMSGLSDNNQDGDWDSKAIAQEVYTFTLDSFPVEVFWMNDENNWDGGNTGFAIRKLTVATSEGGTEHTMWEGLAGSDSETYNYYGSITPMGIHTCFEDYAKNYDMDEYKFYKSITSSSQRAWSDPYKSGTAGTYYLNDYQSGGVSATFSEGVESVASNVYYIDTSSSNTYYINFTNHSKTQNATIVALNNGNRVEGYVDNSIVIKPGETISKKINISGLGNDNNLASFCFRYTLENVYASDALNADLAEFYQPCYIGTWYTSDDAREIADQNNDGYPGFLMKQTEMHLYNQFQADYGIFEVVSQNEEANGSGSFIHTDFTYNYYLDNTETKFSKWEETGFRMKAVKTGETTRRLHLQPDGNGTLGIQGNISNSDASISMADMVLAYSGPSDSFTYPSTTGRPWAYINKPCYPQWDGQSSDRYATLYSDKVTAWFRFCGNLFQNNGISSNAGQIVFNAMQWRKPSIAIVSGTARNVTFSGTINVQVFDKSDLFSYVRDTLLDFAPMGGIIDTHSSRYNKTIFSAYETALSNAMNVLANQKTTQYAVNNALADLKSAVAALQTTDNLVNQIDSLKHIQYVGGIGSEIAAQTDSRYVLIPLGEHNVPAKAEYIGNGTFNDKTNKKSNLATNYTKNDTEIDYLNYYYWNIDFSQIDGTITLVDEALENFDSNTYSSSYKTALENAKAQLEAIDQTTTGDNTPTSQEDVDNVINAATNLLDHMKADFVNHDYDANNDGIDEIKTKASTCAEAGYTYYQCNICGKVHKVADLEKATHQYIEDDDFNYVVFSNEDVHWYECKNCGYKLEYAHNIKYSYNAGDAVHTAYCDYKESYSTACTYSYTEPHTGEWTTTKTPSYTEEGSKTRTCTLCGCVETASIPMLEDTNAPVITTSGNTTDDETFCMGVSVTVTDETEFTVDVTKDGEEYTVDNTANFTLTEVGTYVITATDASNNEVTKTVTVNATHIVDTWTSVDDENHKGTCTTCGEEITASHTFANPELTRPKLVDGKWTDGVYTSTCNCGATDTETIARANYEAYDEAKAALEALLADTTITTEAKDTITDALNENKIADNYVAIKAEQDKIDEAATALNGVLTEIKAGIDDGSMVYVDLDAYKEAFETYVNSTEKVAKAEDKTAAKTAIDSVAGITETSTKANGNQDKIDAAAKVLADLNTMYANCASGNHIGEVITGTAASCDATGLTDGEKCSVCGVITKEQVAIPKAEHKWSVTYTWSDDNSECTATRVCADFATHNETETVKTTNAVTDEATCEKSGTRTYTADFTAEWAEDCTKEVDISATGHDWSVTYTWGADYATCTATRTCANDKNGAHTTYVYASVKSEITTPSTCYEMGETTYTATFTADWAETQIETEKNVPLEKHTWNKATEKFTADTSVENKVGYYTYTCSVENCNGELKIYVEAAEYDALKNLVAELKEIIKNNDLTDEAKKEVQDAIGKAEALPDNLTKSATEDGVTTPDGQGQIDALVAELNKVVTDTNAGITDGSALKPDTSAAEEAVENAEALEEKIELPEEVKTQIDRLRTELNEILKEIEEDDNATDAEYQDRLDAIEEAAKDIVEKYADCSEGHAWVETGFARPTLVDGEWVNGTYTYTCDNCGATKTEPAVRATYTAYDEAKAALEALLADTTLTAEAKAEIEKVLGDNKINDNLVTAEQSIVNAAAEALKTELGKLTDENGKLKDEFKKPDSSAAEEAVENAEGLKETVENLPQGDKEAIDNLREQLDEILKEIEEDDNATDAEYQDRLDAIEEAAKDIVEKYADCSEGHAWVETGFARPTLVDGEWVNGTYTYTCDNCGATKTEPAVRATYTAYDEAMAALEALLADTTLTAEAKAEIEKVLGDNKINDNLVTAEQSIVNAAAEALKTELDKLTDEKGNLKDEYAKVDYIAYNAAVNAYDNLADKMSDADKSAVEAIKTEIAKIPADGSKAQYQTQVDKAAADIAAINGKYAGCVNGNHAWGEPNLTKAPTADAQGEYTEICGICGTTQITKVDLADYEDFNAAVEALENLAKNKNLTDEAKSAIEEALAKAEALDKNLPADVTTVDGKEIKGGQDKIDALVDVLNKVVTDTNAGITDGSLVKPDFDGYDASHDEYEKLVEQYGDKIKDSATGDVAKLDKTVEDLRDDETATKADKQDDVDNAKTDLDTIIDGIKDGSLRDPDYKDVEDKINEAKGNDDLNKDTQDKIKDIEDALQNIKNKEPEANAKDDQDDVDALEDRLDEILEDIKNGTAVAPDYSDAEKAIEDAEKAAGDKLTDEFKNKLDELKKKLDEIKNDSGSNKKDDQAAVDAIENAAKEIADKYKACGKGNHTKGDKFEVVPATCTSKGYTKYICTVCGAEFNADYTDKIPHTEATLEAVPPTCSEVGLTEGKICVVCNKVLVAQQEIKKLPHTDADDDGVCDVCHSSSIYDGCACLCHNTHWFWEIVYIIIRIIWKVFKIHPVCPCGRIHY